MGTLLLSYYPLSHINLIFLAIAGVVIVFPNELGTFLGIGSPQLIRRGTLKVVIHLNICVLVRLKGQLLLV